MNVKQKQTRARKMFLRNIRLRDELWPHIASGSLWDRKESDGFTTMPRPMPHILRIMDYLADKGKPVSEVYLSLWCRVFDGSFMAIQNERDMAFEAGFRKSHCC